VGALTEVEFHLVGLIQLENGDAAFGNCAAHGANFVGYFVEILGVHWGLLVHLYLSDLSQRYRCLYTYIIAISLDLSRGKRDF
jgi:hypothetical protein